MAGRLAPVTDICYISFGFEMASVLVISKPIDVLLVIDFPKSSPPKGTFQSKI